MKSKVIFRGFGILLWMVVMSFSSVAQNIELKFTGRTSGGHYVRLDSVQVENLSQEWTETLVYPDTILKFMGLAVMETGSNVLQMKVFPNPCNGLSTVQLKLSEPELVRLRVFSLSGQTIAESSYSLEAGNHLFDVSLKSSQLYLLAVSTSHGSKVIKIVNLGDGGRNAIMLKEQMVKAVTNVESKHHFRVGDVLRYTGYTTYGDSVVKSQQIVQAQKVSENFLLIFTISTQPHGLPQVQTGAITDITETIAYLTVICLLN